MAVIASKTRSIADQWYATIGLGLALTVAPVMPYMMSHGLQLATNVTLGDGQQATALHTASVPSHTMLQSEANTPYKIPQNLGLPNRREPGGTR